MSSYTPSSVKEILKEMMSISSIQMDLAIASLGMNDLDLAKKVITMEQKVNELINQLFMHASLAIRSPNDAEEFIGLFHIGNAVDAISDSAGNISELLLQDSNPFRERNSVFLLFHEFVDASVAGENSVLIGQNEQDLNLQDQFGVDIMAIKRDDEFFLGHDTEIQQGDMLYVRGPQANVVLFGELNRGRISSIDDARTLLESIEVGSIDVDVRPYERLIKKLIDNTLLMVDLAFLVHIEQEKIYQRTVGQMENTVDQNVKDFMQVILEEYKKGVITTKDMISFSSLASEIEVLADEAFKLAFGIQRTQVSELNLLHDVMEASEETVELVMVDAMSSYIGKTIRESEFETEISGKVFDVLALRRKGKLLPYPSEETIISTGDILVIKKYHDSEQLRREENRD